MKQKETYDRSAVGMRLKERRKQLGWSRKYVAGEIGLVVKYYSDIERGTCGMSVETLMALAKLFQFSMDELIYGKDEKGKETNKSEVLLKNLESLPEEKQEYCLQILFLFMKGLNGSSLQEETVDGPGRNSAQ